MPRLRLKVGDTVTLKTNPKVGGRIVQINRDPQRRKWIAWLEPEENLYDPQAYEDLDQLVKPEESNATSPK